MARSPRSEGPELVWPGKRDDPERPRAEALIPIERLPPGGAGAARGWRNRLVYGDNLAVLTTLRAELAGKVDLVYIDPPFGTGLDFVYRAETGARKRSSEAPRTVTATAYRDGWGPGQTSWFSMMAQRLELARDLLSESGTLYVHVDWSLGHYLRPMLDEIFGSENSLGEIVWAYGSPSGGRTAGKKLVKSHDFIFVFARQYGRHKFRPVYLPYSQRYVDAWFRFVDADGRRYRKRWRRAPDGTSYHERQYLDASKGVPASTVWTDIQQVYADPRAYKAGMTSEVTGYPTQKPVKLIERILALSSDPGDLVLDFFSGSGTTLVAAERMRRRWIGCDAGPQAIQLAVRRLLALPEAPAAFDVERLTGLPLPEVPSPPKVRLERRGHALRVSLSGGELELIERWSVGEVSGETFLPRWTAFRTLRDRTLPLESPRLDGLKHVGIEVVDVLGRVARFCPAPPEASDADRGATRGGSSSRGSRPRAVA